MMYVALTGVFPFADGSNDMLDILAAIKKDEPVDPRDITDLGAIDDEVAELVMHGLQKDPANRFGGGPECALRMAEALELALTNTSDAGFDFFINCKRPPFHLLLRHPRRAFYWARLTRIARVQTGSGVTRSRPTPSSRSPPP